MKIQLMENPMQYSMGSALERVLMHRGVTDVSHLLNTSDKDICSFLLFGESRLKAALSKLLKTIQNDADAVVIVDSDCDGFTSAALLINYLHDLFPYWVENNLTWFMHEGKQHGLSDFTPKFNNPDLKLILIPDAGSNDYEYHQYFKERNIDIIILDHHEAEIESEDAIVINNQLSDYPNKELSGVGVTWQFCKYIDSVLNVDYADSYLDLVALGLDADMMSLKSFETKHLINKGFKQIQNPFFEAMIEKNGYQMKDKINPISVAFYVAPYVNAIVRSGTIDEKQIVFRSMLKFEAFQKILSTKRGHKLGEMETVLSQAMRVVVNVKNRQTRAQEAGLELLENMIINQNLLNHKVLLFLLEPGQIDKNIAGLIANKFMAKYQRPCCILTKIVDIPSENEIIISYQGSARGYDKSGITNFKDICAETNAIMYAEGHQGAFGLGILEENIVTFIEKTDIALKDMNPDPVYFVDFLYYGCDVNSTDIIDIGQADYLWGKDLDEPFVAIHDLKITKDMVVLMAPDKKPTLKIILPNGVNLIKFNSNQEEYEQFMSDGYIAIDVVGRCNANEWREIITPQILIEDYEIIDSSKYFF